MQESLGDQAKEVGRVLWGTLKAFRNERGTTTAAALAYSTFLSLIPICLLLLIVVDPLAAALTSDLAGSAGVAEGESGQKFIDAMLGWVAPSSRAEILSYLNDTAAGLRANKGSLGLLGFGGFIVTSVLLFISIEDALNDVWKSPRRRKLGTRIAYFWCVATLVPVAVLFSMTAVSGLPLLGDAMSSAGVQTLLQWCVSVLLMGGMYLIFPVSNVSWRAAFWGAVAAASLFELSKWGFAHYIKTAIAYQALYGSLAVVPLFIVWTYVGWAVVLLGAHLARIVDGGLPKPKTPPAPERVAFAIAIEVARHFLEGKGPMSTADVSAHLAMEPDAVESASKRLCAAGILAEIEQPDDGDAVLLLPAKDPRELPAIDLVVAARDAGNEEVGGIELKEALRLMDDAARAASAGLTLAGLAGGRTEPPPVAGEAVTHTSDTQPELPAPPAAATDPATDPAPAAENDPAPEPAPAPDPPKES